MNKYRKLFSNSLVFAMGNLGSKMITFFMVPLYTRYLTTSQYGKSDVLSTLVSLLTPILTLSIIDAVFRFAMDENSDNSKVLTNGIFLSLISLVVFAVVSPIVHQFDYAVYVCLLTYMSAIESMFQQFARGIGKSKLYATTGIIMTAATVISNIILIVWQGWALQGYLASMMVAQIVGLLFLFISLRSWKYIHLTAIDIEFLKRMLVYSIPLIPNMVSWWLSNSANKIFISFMLGTAANGIYAVANKIPSLISVFYSIFTQAWQISAVEEFKSKDVGAFFSKVMSATISVLMMGVAILTLWSQLLVRILSTPAYYDAWRIVPWLALAVLFSSVSSFLGTVYTASMKTGKLFTTTIVGALVNVGSNVLLIPLLGVVGAGTGAALSFLVVTLLRFRDSKRFINLKVTWTPFVIAFVIILGEILALNVLPGIIGFSVAGGCTLLVFIINWKIISPMLSKTISAVFKRK